MWITNLIESKLKIYNFTLAKIIVNEGKIRLSILRIIFLKYKSVLAELISNISENKNIDCTSIDFKILDITQNITIPRTILKNNQPETIVYLATEVYNTGGHSKCIYEHTDILKEKYKQVLFLSRFNNIRNHSKKILRQISLNAEIVPVDCSIYNFKKNISNIALQIISKNPKFIFVFIHPDDLILAATLSLIKKNSQIKILFFNHASHYPCIGMHFADWIVEGTQTTESITNLKRHLNNTKIIGLISKRSNETVYYTNTEKEKIRQSLCIPNKSYITLSGGASYKFFDKNGSRYFRMIAKLLKENSNIVHIIISAFSEQQISIINTEIEEEIKKRIKFLPFTDNFDQYFQLADVYIDSFPVAGALTQVDLMRNKVASVAYKNVNNSELSFEEYLKPNYPYLFDCPEEMIKGVLNLLYDEVKRSKLVDENYEYWLCTYEKTAYTERFLSFLRSIK